MTACKAVTASLAGVKPSNFGDIIALVSLYRPGPMDNIPLFGKRKAGEVPIEYPHPKLEEILAETYGIFVYQEQVMQAAQVMGGYSLGGADLLRRAMGKKKPEEMAKERVKFEAGAAERNIESANASAIFDLMEKFADYGFNKSHSAAYALVAYQTAWLKAHYPAEFMAATLSSDMDNTDKVVTFLDEAREIGLAVLPPDVNSSGYMFEALDAKTVRYGLGAVKGVGRGACESIVEARQAGGPFRDLLDFLRRVDSSKLNRRVLEALVNAGALDALGANRATLMLQLPEVIKATEQLARERAAGQVSLFGGGGDAPAIHIELPEAPDWPLETKLLGERETLGHYLSGHPLDPWRAELQGLVGVSLADLDHLWSSKKDRRGEAAVVLAGIVTAVRRRGDTMAFVRIEDGRGQLEVAFFREAFAESGHLLSRDRILLVEGNLAEDQFSGGFVLRARQCWDFRALCAQHGHAIIQHFAIDVGALEDHGPGRPPLRRGKARRRARRRLGRVRRGHRLAAAGDAVQRPGAVPWPHRQRQPGGQQRTVARCPAPAHRTTAGHRGHQPLGAPPLRQRPDRRGLPDRGRWQALDAQARAGALQGAEPQRPDLLSQRGAAPRRAASP